MWHYKDPLLNFSFSEMQVNWLLNQRLAFPEINISDMYFIVTGDKLGTGEPITDLTNSPILACWHRRTAWPPLYPVPIRSRLVSSG